MSPCYNPFLSFCQVQNCSGLNENFYGYTKILYIAIFEVLTAIDAENSSLMGCEVMLCCRASVSCTSVLLWLLEPEKM